VEGDTAVTLHRTLTPAQVISWLPRSATPAQQDSAVQAHFQPGEIHWSNRPDTLHLPGHDKGRNLLDINIPQYYREGFFSNDTLFHPELPGGRYGVAGDPVPYSVRGDNVITSILLVCFVLAVIAFSITRSFIVRQLHSIFHLPHQGTSEVSETGTELRFLFFLVFITCLLLSLLYFFYTVNYVGHTFILSSEYHLIAIYLAIIVTYFPLKMLLYSAVNSVFFDSKKNGQWLKVLLFITAIEGVLLFPAVILLAYLGFSVQNVANYFTFVLIIVKILTFYKCYVIFFRGNVFFLQIILYFCALEMVPLLFLWGALDITANMLKVIF
jgi:hypothetical protein